MIENPYPSNWRQLQERVKQIFTEIGISAETNKIVTTPRGKIEVDVFGIDLLSVDKIEYVVECKNWSKNIPQGVVHSFTTVMHELGSHIGYIISKNGFQKGAKTYLKNTNIKGLTFLEFQNHYFHEWYDKLFKKIIYDKIDYLVQYTEIFNSFRDRKIESLSENNKIMYYKLVKKYSMFAQALLVLSSPISSKYNIEWIKDLNIFIEKIEESLNHSKEFKAKYYRDFLNELISEIEKYTKEFNNIFGGNIFA